MIMRSSAASRRGRAARGDRDRLRAHRRHEGVAELLARLAELLLGEDLLLLDRGVAGVDDT